jgi:hypothetical protein
MISAAGPGGDPGAETCAAELAVVDGGSALEAADGARNTESADGEPVAVGVG